MKAAHSTYPPILPALLWAASIVLDPFTAAKLLGAVASVSAGIPLYLAASSVRRELSVLTTSAFITPRPYSAS